MFALIDHTARLFGREADLAYLTGRAAARGLTAIVARPQMGKSWTMVEAARRLDAGGTLVGFAEATGTTSDLLLRAVADLYERWLSQASYGAQLRQVWAQQKDRVLPAVAKAVSTIVEELPGVGKAVGGLIGKALDGLLAANEDLKSGRLTLPPLPYEQARDLVRVVAETSGKPVALFLDAWQLSAKPDEAIQPLAAFVRKRDDWPLCHVLLALAENEIAEAPLRALAAGEAGAATVRELRPIDLTLPAEGARAVAWLHATVPATVAYGQIALLSLIDGYPGVIYRWTAEEQRTAMRDWHDLERVADDAQAYRFSELETLLDTLDKDARRLAIRVALLPLAATVDGWTALRPAVVDGLDEALLDDLSDSEVLETSDPPSYGHAKRAEAAREWFAAKRPVQRRQEAEKLCVALGRGIADVSPAALPFASALRDLDPVASLPEFDPWARALTHAAISLFGGDVPAEALIVPLAAGEKWGGAGAALLAMGAGNAIERGRWVKDTAPVDGLLDVFRAIAAAHRDNARLQAALAATLHNVIWNARIAGNVARERTLLDELRALVAAAPDNARVRDSFGQTAFNALRHGDERGASETAWTLLDDLRANARAMPDDPLLAEALARGLYQLGTASPHTSAERQADLQAELLALSRRWRGRHWFDNVLAKDATVFTRISWQTE